MHPECGVAIVDIAEAERFAQALSGTGLEVRAVGQVDGHNAVKGQDLTLSVFVTAQSALQPAE
jgi:hypothetical protein